MRVNQPNNSTVQNADISGAKSSGRAVAANKAKSGEAASATGNASGISAGTAELSNRGKDLAKAKAVAADAPDVREEKIAELRSRIAAGKYNVDATAVADRMVDDHASMAGIG